MEKIVVQLVVWSLLFACFGRQGRSDYEETYVDISAERMILYGCAEDEMRARYTVAIASPSLQRVISEWEFSGETRTRTSASILYDALFGPGIQVFRRREYWQSEDPPEQEGEFWQTISQERGDREIEEEIAFAIQRCWREQRDE